MVLLMMQRMRLAGETSKQLSEHESSYDVTMNVIIQTGFEAISHTILFQPQTMNKGKLLVTAGHVRDVKEFRQNGRSYLIKSKVIRQTSVTLTPYDTTLHINGERLVEEVSCTCVYNQSKKCKHIAALIYYINHEESFTQTSHEQQWGKPSARQFAKEKYAKGRYFIEMFPAKKVIDTKENKPLSVDLEELIDESALKLVLLADRVSDDSDVITKLSSAQATAAALNLKQEECQECLRYFLIFLEEFALYSNEYKLQKDIEDFYCDNIVISDEDIVKLCSQTLNQSQCPEWYAARRFRLSASSNIHRIKTRTRKTIDKLVDDILYPRSVDTESTQYGLRHETNAKKKYEELNGCEVKNVGLIVSNKQPWLCASVDGVVIEDDCVKKLVEFKCPFKCKNQPVIDRINQSCNVKYLNFVKDDAQLNENDLYFTQIQVQLYVTGMFTCDLFVYSPVTDGCCTVRIERDEKFLKEVILKAENFYFNHYLPAAMLRFIKEKNETTNSSVEFYEKRSFTGENVVNVSR